MNINLEKKLVNILFDARPSTEKDFEHSRRMSIFEGCTARTIFNFTSGAFLAGYANFLGADDSFNGLIGAIPVLAGVMSLLSPLYFEKKDRRKPLVVLLNFLHRFILGLMVLIPLIASGKSERLALVTVFYLVAYMAISFSNPAASAILIDLTPENIRGRYFSKKESYFLAVGTLFTLVLGPVMDSYKAGGNEYGGFVIMFVIVLLLSFANGYFWLRIKEPDRVKSKTTFKLKQIVTMPLKNLGFRKIIIFFILYNVGLQIGGPFFSVYMVTGLKLDYSYIMVMGMLFTIVDVILVRVWGRVADRKSWNFVLTYSILTLGIAHFSWFFVNGSTAFIMVPLLHILSGAGWAGLGISTFNIQFIYSPADGNTVYIGFNAALGGLMGFLGTLAGSGLLIVMHGMGLNLSGFMISGMQVLFLLSGLTLMLSAAYSHFFIKPFAQE
jgi:Na+/melibiose symporter-like transporter